MPNSEPSSAPALERGVPTPGTSSRTGGAIAALLLLVALGVAALVPVVFGDAPQDDAYISYVYARNLVRGHGLVFNPGETPVEGYTNFLWTLGVAGLMRGGANPERVVPWIGLAFTLWTVGLTFVLARRLGAAPIFAGLAALIFATRPALAVHAMGGMETPLFGLLLVAGLLARLPRETGAGGIPGRGWASSVWLGLAALTRPEGILLFGLLEIGEAVAAFARREGLGPWLRRAVVRALPFLVITGAHLAWRRATYGDWVPNTFHAKVSPGPQTWADGLDYVFYGAMYFGPILLFLPLVALTGRRAAERRLTLFVSTAFAAYVVYVGGDYIPSYRFLWPIMPLWSALAAAPLSLVVERVPVGSPGARTAAAAALLLAALGFHTAFEYVDGHRWAGMHERHDQLVAAGEELDRVLAEDAWIAATNVGRIPYFAERKTLDMMGLNDLHIARAPMAESTELAGHLKGDGGYVLDREPEAILFLRLVLTQTPQAENPNWWSAARSLAFGVSEQEIVRDKRFYQDYRLVSLPLDGVWLNVFARDGAFRGGGLPAGARTVASKENP